MSHEKSFNEFIYNSKWQIIIHQRAFIYDRLSFSFPFWSSEKFKIKGTDSFLIFWVTKVAGASERVASETTATGASGEQRKDRLPNRLCLTGLGSYVKWRFRSVDYYRSTSIQRTPSGPRVGFVNNKPTNKTFFFYLASESTVANISNS